MGFCYYCEHDITTFDIFMQRRIEIGTKGDDCIYYDRMHVHKDCHMLFKKYGKDYFIIQRYLEHDDALSELNLKRILTYIWKSSTSIYMETLLKDLKLTNYKEAVEKFWEFLIINGSINESTNAPTLPKST